jgi:hypothetical protein
MGEFDLGKIPLTREEFCVRGRLALGKLDPRLFSVHVNAGVDCFLHDINYGAGKLSLYPVVDLMNFVINRVARKVQLEFYVNNNNPVAQFMFVEVGIPNLQVFDSYLSANAATHDWGYWMLSLWDSDHYVEVMAPETGLDANYVWNSQLSKYLDGSTFFDVNSEGASYWSLNSAAAFASGQRGQTKTRKYDGMANAAITYSNRRFCRRRLGFCIKLPGDDGNDSNVSGASQCRVKLNIWYW